MPLPAGGDRLGYVDGLRGYLACFVMIYHFTLYVEVTRLGGVWARPSMGFLDSLGPGSVNLFFMTTGFVFYPRILSGFRSVNWINVYVSRLFRIVPLVIFATFAAALLILVRLDFQPHAPIGDTVIAMVRWITCWDQPDLFGYPNSGQVDGSVMWSLWFEWLFYIFVLPACAAAMELRGRMPTWAIPAGLILVSLVLKPFHLLPLIDFLPLFGIGMLAFELRQRTIVATVLSDSAASFLAPACLVVGAIFLTGAPRMILHAIFFFCVASSCSLGGLLRTSGARVLGEVSYGIYLLHMLVLNILFVSLAPQIASIGAETLPVLLPIIAIATVLLAATSFLVLERPAMRLGRKLSSHFASWLATSSIFGRREKSRPTLG